MVTSLHEMPTLVLRSIDTGWNRQRWEQLPSDGNRYEVIDGVLYMTTAPSSFHQWIIQQIFLALHDQLDKTGVGHIYWSPIGVFMPQCDPVQPDLLVLRKEDLSMLRERRVHGVPALMVEVVSPSNAEQDTRVKKQAYASAGVPEYWIVRPATRDILVCSQPDHDLGDYTHVELVPPGGTLTSPTLPVKTAIAHFFEGHPDTEL